MTMESVATESIKIQINNNLAKELDKFYTKVIQYKNEYIRDNPDLNYTQRIEGFKSIFNREYKDELQSIINKYTNIDCKQISLSNTFAITILGKDLSTMIMGVLAASGKLKPESISPKELEKLINLDTSIDYKKAKITKLPISIYAKLYFDFYTSFFPEETSYGNASNIKLTPQELTAITLHEIGHVFTMVEYASQLMYTGYYSNNLIYKYLHANEQQQKRIINYVQKNPEWFEKLYLKIKANKVFDESNKLVSTTLNPTILKSIKIITTIRTVYTVVSIIFKVIFTIFVALWGLAFFIKFVFKYLLEEHIESFIVARQGKTTETASLRQSYLLETLADEFVSKFGYSKYLNSSLNKIHKYRSIHVSSTVKQILTSRIFIVSTIMRCIASVMSLFRLPLYLFNVINKSGYQSLTERLERNLYNMYDIIKQAEDLPIDYQKSILNDIEDMRNQLYSFSLDNATQMSKFGKIFEFGLNYVLLGKFQKAFISGVFSDAQMKTEIRQFLEVTDKLLSNSLYYHSAKLKQIAKEL